MIEIKKYNEANIVDIKLLWNNEIGFIYPIADNIFEQNIVQNKYLAQDASFIAYYENKAIGFIVAKKWDNDSIIESYKNLGWISLFYVAKKFRNQGIGSKLFLLCEKNLKEMGITKIDIGKDINNFFPGIPADFDNLTSDWLKKRGYIIGRYTHDLTMCNKNLKLEVANKKAIYRTATLQDKEVLLDMIMRNFPGRWYFECYSYFKNGGTGHEYALAILDDKIVGFARINDCSFKEYHYNTTWYQRFDKLGGLGPLGVDKTMRGNKLGGDIIVWSLNELKARGCNDILIDWTGLMELYQKYGFEVWKNYQYVYKNI